MLLYKNIQIYICFFEFLIVNILIKLDWEGLWTRNYFCNTFQTPALQLIGKVLGYNLQQNPKTARLSV